MGVVNTGGCGLFGRTGSNLLPTALSGIYSPQNLVPSVARVILAARRVRRAVVPEISVSICFST